MVIFTNFSPSKNEEDVVRTSVVSFTLIDDGYSIDINTLGLKIAEQQVISNGTFVNEYSGKIFTTYGKYVVGVYPKLPFFAKASKIDVDIEVYDNDNLNTESYSFYTVGYNAPDVDNSVSTPSRACPSGKPFFPPTDLGLSVALDKGTGTEAELQWKEAFPNDEDNIIFYNVYYSSNREDIFDGYPEFIVSDTKATIGGLPPGDTHYFAVRAAEFNPLVFTINGLQQAGIDMFFYPTTVLDGYISDSATLITANTDGFPTFGIIHLGTELIKYSSLNEIPSGFITDAYGRGYAGTLAESHADNITIRLYNGKEDSNTNIFCATPTFQKPNYALTWIKSDGYGPDGYRDGYDGYDAYYNGLGTSRLFDGYDGYYIYHGKSRDSITTDGTNNDASGNFNRFDYCGTWRTMSPQSFMQGQCRSSYFGGVQVRVDNDGYRHLVKTDVRTHMLQREELLLESTGEPFVLLRRMWTGTHCMCYMNRREHPDARCPICFVPGTLINTKRGFIPIEEIKIGEEVLSDDGEYKKVVNIMERNYNGDVYKIETYTSNPIITTPEHPFLTVISKHNIIRPCGPKIIKNRDDDVNPKLMPSGNWRARVTDKNSERISLGTFSDKKDAEMAIKNYHSMNIHKLDWKDAKDLHKGDWLENKWSNEIVDIEKIFIPIQYLKQIDFVRNDVKEFNVDEDFLWIIGMYLAEGSSGTRHISFSLHKKKINYQNKILKYFKELGFNGVIRKTSENGVSVDINSTSLSLWFQKLLGKKCYNKKIPIDFMNLPHHKLISLIQGIWDGNGNKNCNEIRQTSKILALQIIEILHKLGKQPHLIRRQSSFLTKNGNFCYIVTWKGEILVHNNRKNSWEFKKELLVRIKDISKEYYSGKVYNLEVEDRHTYVVENIVVHNCFNTGFVQGFIQFFNSRRSDRRLLIRVDPATDDLSIVDRGGLEPLYEPSAWTLPFPAIKDRDILVRFNSNNTEEFRYEILDVTRVRALFTQTGAQKFRMKRLPKTSLMYQFPIVRDTKPIPGAIITSTNSGPGLNPHFHQLIIRIGTNLTKIRSATLESENHNHIVINGIVQQVLGHTHIL